MEDEFISKNAAFIEKELKWLDERITSQLGNAGFEVPSHITPSAIDLEGADKPNYVQILESNGLSKIGTRLILALALAPHLRPELLDKFFEYNEPYKRGIPNLEGSVEKTIVDLSQL